MTNNTMTVDELNELAKGMQQIIALAKELAMEDIPHDIENQVAVMHEAIELADQVPDALVALESIPYDLDEQAKSMSAVIELAEPFAEVLEKLPSIDELNDYAAAMRAVIELSEQLPETVGS